MKTEDTQLQHGIPWGGHESLTSGVLIFKSFESEVILEKRGKFDISVVKLIGLLTMYTQSILELKIYKEN